MTSIYPHCPTASHLSSLTRHFVVGISRMEVIAHARTSSNDRRSHRYDTGISSEYVIDFYCPFGPPPLILSLACDTILIISQEALFCYPHRFRLLHSPQHSWGIRLFIQFYTKTPIESVCQVYSSFRTTPISSFMQTDFLLISSGAYASPWFRHT